MTFAKKSLAGIVISCQLMPFHIYAQNTQSSSDAAYIIQRVGGAAAEGGDGLQQLAGEYASASVNEALHDAIAPFGTLHSNLTLDSDFSLRSAEIDALLPIYDREGNLVFTQVGTRKNADRITSNFGLGTRYFFADTMLGVNAFYDVQWKQQHQRLGIGVEWWRDNLKLAANGYFGLSDWVQSPILADYDERPADGWDIRAEGWLPAYPQLGGKLTFAQYYGEGVTLFGDSERQVNPFAMTAGLSYTPFPLLTAELEHRIGAQGMNDTRLSLGVNLQLGIPWSQQLDPRGVSRTLAHHRYDVVSRNNDIVLNTRKQTLITLSLPAQLDGQAGASLTLTPTITAKYGASHVVLQDRELVRAGGAVLQSDVRHIVIRLPEQGSPVRLGVTAYDIRGNASQTQYVQLTTRAPTGTHLTLSASEQQVPTSRSITLTLVAADANGQPLSGDAVTWSSNNGMLDGQPQTDARGRATATLHNVIAGQVRVTAHVKGQSITSDTLTFTPVHYATLLMDKTAAIANGEDSVRYSLTVRDGQGLPVAGSPVQWRSNLGELSNISATTDAQGVAHATLRSRYQGDAVVQVVQGEQLVSAPAVQFSTLLTGQVAVSQNQALANGQDGITYTLVLRDSADLPRAGAPVTWTTTLGEWVSHDAVTNASGAASATLRSRHAGQAAVTVRTDQTTQSAPVVVFSPVLYPTLTVSKTSAPADGVSEVCYRFALQNAAGEPVSGHALRWSTSVGVLSAVHAQTDDQGKASACLTGTSPGIATVAVSGEGFSVSASPVTFTSSVTGALTSTAQTYPGVALPVTLLVRDAAGRPVPDMAITWQSSSPANLTPATGKTDAAGQLTVNATFHVAGTHTLSAVFAGQSVNQTITVAPGLRIQQVIGIKADGSAGKNFGTHAPYFLWPGATLRLSAENQVGTITWVASDDAVTVDGDTVRVLHRPDNTTLIGQDSAGQRVTLQLNSRWVAQTATEHLAMRTAAPARCESLGASVATLHLMRAVIADWGNDLPAYPGWVNVRHSPLKTSSTQVGDDATGSFIHRWSISFSSGEVLEQLSYNSGNTDYGFFACY
ncbi:inverse autotransporter beta domain-containing protein (plasmid) [Edwardsiella tarda]|uniref:inverse autotransporter beta domain-containing protein n=1 Tax=Edwardsiella tarda TaxID=636 RepID=UPI000D506369|nr:inverse autotransporter beta domain-containing protein [Edwardsiella tarda]UCQ29603.1 inverse autotransporter beta domain-containing protein [Edwardsiella tarda]